MHQCDEDGCHTAMSAGARRLACRAGDALVEGAVRAVADSVQKYRARCWATKNCLRVYVCMCVCVYECARVDLCGCMRARANDLW